jgi:hypothetical protein
VTIISVSYKTTNNIQIFANIYILFVFLYDTLMMVAEVTNMSVNSNTVYDKTYFADNILYCTNMGHIKFSIINFIMFVLSRFRTDLLTAKPFNRIRENEI